MHDRKLMQQPTLHRGWIAAVLLGLTLAACGARDDGQPRFETPEAAFEALIIALEAGDLAAATKLLGPGVEELLDSGDAVQDQGDRVGFIAAYRTRHSLEADGDSRRTLLVGDDDWPFLIPAIRRDGKWVLDGEAGADELVYRRVGENELGAIAVARGFVEAQQEYAATGHDGDPPGIYALKLISDPGLENGLYWETAADEAPSPAGAFVAAAAGEGYRSGQGVPYHGYRYRMLFKQGPNAKGGAREYFQDGLLTQGFALVAWPAEYGSSGVMTFIVNQDGDVYQKDLGADTDTAVKALTSFDPDSTWKLVSATPEG